jgi:large subunit ribosomal protein L10
VIALAKPDADPTTPDGGLTLINHQPTHGAALAMLARVLAEPASMFARAIRAVADQQGGGEAAPEVVAEAEPA